MVSQKDMETTLIFLFRYDKIIIMADADVDGEHISTLFNDIFLPLYAGTDSEGHVYIAMPLYKAVPKRGQEQHL